MKSQQQWKIFKRNKGAELLTKLIRLNDGREVVNIKHEWNEKNTNKQLTHLYSCGK